MGMNERWWGMWCKPNWVDGSSWNGTKAFNIHK